MVSRPPEEVIEASDKQAEVAPHIQDDFNDIDEDELKEAASKAGMTAFQVFTFLFTYLLPSIESNSIEQDIGSSWSYTQANT